MCSSPIVGHLAGMLAAVDFYYQPLFETEEVGDVWAQRMLSAEPIPGQLSATELLPKGPLGLGGIFPQLPGRGFDRPPS